MASQEHALLTKYASMPQNILNSNIVMGCVSRSTGYTWVIPIHWGNCKKVATTSANNIADPAARRISPMALWHYALP